MDLPLGDDPYGTLHAELGRMSRAAGRSLSNREFLDARADINRAGGGNGDSRYLSNPAVADYFRQFDLRRPVVPIRDPFRLSSPFELRDPFER